MNAALTRTSALVLARSQFPVRLFTCVPCCVRGLQAAHMGLHLMELDTKTNEFR